MPCMFYLCRVSRPRQELASVCGIIPHLQRCIVEKSPLKQFALPIICDLAHTSTQARERLRRNNGVQFYFTLLTEQHWQIAALNSIADWSLCPIVALYDRLANRMAHWLRAFSLGLGRMWPTWSRKLWN